MTTGERAAMPGTQGRDADPSPPDGARRREVFGDEESLRQSIYANSDLSRYGLRDRVIIRAADIFFYLLIRLVCSTLRWEVRGAEHLDRLVESGHRAIFTSWHVCIFTATWFWRERGIVVMSSQSRDAEFTNRFIKRFGYGTARGSATRGSGRALTEMAECLRKGLHAGFTIDGPRGPAFVAKPGAITLARHSGQAVLPFHISTRRYLEIPSWDRLQVPIPFTRAVALIAEPVFVPGDATSGEVAALHSSLQATLDRLKSEADRLARGGR